MADTANGGASAKPTEVQKAEADARSAEIKAQEAQAKADEAGKSPEQKAADKAKAAADDARAEAAAVHAAPEPEAVTVDEAKVHAPVPGDLSAGHHRAQKFGNDPANPAPANGDHADPDLQTVKLTRTSPDADAPVTTMVHPEMVGDYLRAGWSKA